MPPRHSRVARSGFSWEVYYVAMGARKSRRGADSQFALLPAARQCCLTHPSMFAWLRFLAANSGQASKCLVGSHWLSKERVQQQHRCGTISIQVLEMRWRQDNAHLPILPPEEKSQRACGTYCHSHSTQEHELQITFFQPILALAIKDSGSCRVDIVPRLIHHLIWFYGAMFQLTSGL